MSRHRSSRAALALSIATLLATALAASQMPAENPKAGFADPVLGRWDLTVHGADAPYPSWLDVQLRKETELMARFVGRFGSVRHATAVSYRDGRLAVRIPVQYEKNEADLQFDGRLVGERLEGTTVGEEGRTLKWTAVRAPALMREGVPSWGAAVALLNGRDLTGWKAA